MADEWNFKAAGIEVIDQNAPEAEAPVANAVQAPVDNGQVDAPPASSTPAPATESVNPPAATPVTDAPVAPVWDEQKYIKETFGDIFDSRDAVKNTLEKARQVDELSKKAQDLQKYIDENDFVDDYGRAENKFVKEGGDRNLFREVNSIDVDKMTDAEAVRKSIELKNKTLTKDEIDLLVSRKYKIGQDEYDDDVREASINLKIDGQAAKEFLGKYKVENLVPPAVKQKGELQRQQEQSEQNTARNIESWDKNYSTVVPQSKKITFVLDEKEGLSMDYEITDFNSDKMKQEALSVIKMMGLTYGEDKSKKDIEEYLVNRRLQQEMPNIAKAIASKVRTDRDEHWIKQTNNPSALRPQDAPPAPSTDRAQKLDHMAAAYK